MKRLASLLVVLVLVAALFAGCSAMPYDESDSYYAKGEYQAASEEAGYDMAVPESPQEAPAAEAEDGSFGAGDTAANYDSMLQPGVNRKVIFSGYLGIQTTNFDEVYQSIKSTLSEFEGYVENSSIYGTKPKNWNDSGRTANFTLRVPSKRFDEFIGRLQGFGETISISTSGQDISTQYFDTETRLKKLRIREERLIGLLEEAKGLEDIIKLEQELANVAYEIEMHETNLRGYDSLVDFSTINIELREVNQVERVTPADKDLGTRIQTGFYSVLNVLADIGEGLLIFLLAGSPVLIPLGIIAVIVVVIVKRRKKAKEEKKNQNS